MKSDRKEFELVPETLASLRSTHSSHNIKKSECLSIFEKNDNPKGFAIPYVHVPLVQVGKKGVGVYQEELKKDMPPIIMQDGKIDLIKIL